MEATHLNDEIQSQILLLKRLHHNPNPSAFKNIVSLFLSSRMAISPEDPDVFERAVTVLVQHAQLFPAEWNEFGTNQLPQLLFENLNRHAIHRFGAELPSSEKEILLQPELAKMDEMVNALKPQIEHAWTDHGIEWLEGWKSENGALGDADHQTCGLALVHTTSQNTKSQHGVPIHL